MTLSYDETKELIDFILATAKEDVHKSVHLKLIGKGRTEPEFYDGIIKHGPFMPYTSEQWFDLHSKIPHWRFLRLHPLRGMRRSPVARSFATIPRSWINFQGYNGGDFPNVTSNGNRGGDEF